MREGGRERDMEGENKGKRRVDGKENEKIGGIKAMNEWEKRRGGRKEGRKGVKKRNEIEKEKREERKVKGGHRVHLIHSCLVGESFAKDAEPGSSTREEVRSPPPSLGAPTTSKDSVKIGVPTNKELETISENIAERWKSLGRGLEIKEPKLIAFHKENEEYTEKAYKMLLHWKSRDGSNATYLVLDDALCHPWVNRKDLAEEICRQ